MVQIPVEISPNIGKQAKRDLLALVETEKEHSERRRSLVYNRPHQCWYKYGLPWTLAQWRNPLSLFSKIGWQTLF